MFETFYGFERTPFTRSIDTDGLFLSQKTDEMLARLQVAASRQAVLFCPRTIANWQQR